MKLKSGAWNSFIDILFHKGTKYEPRYESYFFSIPVFYISRKKAKFGQTAWKEGRKELFTASNSQLDCFHISASRSQWQSQNNGKCFEAHKETFPRNRSLEREFLRTLCRTLLNITYFGNLYHYRYSVPTTSSRGLTSRMPFIQYFSVLLISWL